MFFYLMFLIDVLSKGMSNIYYWEKLTFSNLRFSRKENLKKGTRFKEQKGPRYIQGNVYFGIIVFSCLAYTNQCLRILLICFTREKKGFYQSSLANEVDFTDIMNVSQNILVNSFMTEEWTGFYIIMASVMKELKIKISVNGDKAFYMKEEWLQRH